MSSTGSILRVVAVALALLAIWFVSRDVNGMPEPKGPDAAPTEFSSSRANATLGRLLGPEVPHPVSSPANAAVRDRIRAEFAALGVQTTLYKAVGCNGRANYGFFACGTVEDILAEVAPGEGKAIILLAHYDSVPAGPGASDDQSGVATVLETVRALKARGLKTKHPILAVITDGEEAGLLGAAAFVDNAKFRDRVGVVVNVEARGNQGPSLLFQTSPGDSKLIDLYDAQVPAFATSSLFAVIYKALPNDTDLTVFLNKGLTGVNFAFSGNVAHYHTPLDTRVHLDPSTLQMHGDNMLGVVSGLMTTDFETLKGGDAVYLTLLGHFIPRLPSSWALPLALLALAMVVAAAFLSRGEVLGIGRRLAAFSIPLAAVLGAAAIGWVLHTIASLVSGQPDPSYAYPAWLRASLGLGTFAVILLTARLASARMAALSVWGWTALLAVVTAALLPGLSPYFLFPSLVGGVLLLAQARLDGAWAGTVGKAALLLAALLPLLIWLALAAAGESVQGLALHPLVTVPIAFGAMLVVPYLALINVPRRTWLAICGGTAALAVAVAVIAGLQPAYSEIAPQRLNIAFIDDHVQNKALWTADTSALLPAPLRRAAQWSDKPEQATPVAQGLSYVAQAGATRFTAPGADIRSEAAGNGRKVALTLRASPEAVRIVLAVPKDAALTAVEIDGHAMQTQPTTLNPRGTFILCVTRDCSGKTVTLTFADRKPVDLLVAEQRQGIPADGANLLAARPATATSSQSGDVTTVFGKLRVP